MEAIVPFRAETLARAPPARIQGPALPPAPNRLEKRARALAARLRQAFVRTPRASARADPCCGGACC